jgi:predicted aspartyl protease
VRADIKVCKAVSSEKLERFLVMGFAKVRVGLYNPLQPEKVIEVDAIADTGAIYSIVRRDLLEKLGIKPLRRRRLLEATLRGM